MADIEQGAWYVAHTYSGYENKVKTEIEKTIENRNMQDQIFEVSIPMEDVIETKEVKEDGVLVTKKVTVQRKLFPGYVLVNMIMNDSTWYVIRNTRGVTGFVGPESKPTPLSDVELARMGLKKIRVKAQFAVGDTIQVTSEALRGTEGVIREINEKKQTVTIMVEMFGRETPVELNFNEIKKM